MNIEKEKRAIEYLKCFEPQTEPYYLCYSGGKDSDVIRILALLAGVNHELHHNHTTVDAPETVRYVRSIDNCIIDYPELTMWQLIEKKLIPPTRLIRYCCSELKEKGGKGRVKVTGVRWDESVARKENSGFVKIIGKPKTVQKKGEELNADFILTEKGGVVLNTDNDINRRFVEACYRTTSTLVNPIVDWTDADVWEFLNHYGCKSNPLYQCGEKRIGCVGCPLQGAKGMRRDFERLPKYKELYIRAFDRMLKRRTEKGLKAGSWTDGEAVFKWWIGDDPNQVSLFDIYDEEEIMMWSGGNEEE